MKYTKEQRLDIGRRIYSGEIIKFSKNASKKPPPLLPPPNRDIIETITRRYSFVGLIDKEERQMYDVVIIGAGAVGSATARELSRHEGRFLVLEADCDVCSGTTKANSAIVHAGYDAVPGSLKAKYNVWGSRVMEALSEELDFPYKKTGSLVVCRKDQDRAELERLLEQGKKNGVEGLSIIERDQIIEMEPQIADEVTCALYAPTAAIICPFGMNIAFAENAADNGVEFAFNSKVTGVKKVGDHFSIKTENSEYQARAVVNAAGVYADIIHNMVSEKKIHITARRGQYELLDKSAAGICSHTIFQLPSKLGKGILVTPTVHGNVLIGPTAEDIPDKEDTETTADGLSRVEEMSALSIKDIPYRSVITSFAGLRAHDDGGDFIIGEAEDCSGFFDAAGIESPGLSSAPAIGADLAMMVAESLSLRENERFNGTRIGILDPKKLSAEDRNTLIKEHPEYGQIICRCESVTAGEIKDAITRTLGARTLDGIKRRTRAGMGRCQAGFCTPRQMELLEKYAGLSPEQVTKSGGDSLLVYGRTK